MQHSGDSVQVARLRVHAQGVDPLTARLQLAPLLANGLTRPANLPPGAVLCINRLADPLPGTLSLARSHRPSTATWERAVAAALDQLARQAVRPLHETVPANADAVLFADQSELLACLGRAWLSGEIITQWWWQTLFGGNVPDRVISIWHESAEYIPAALEHLARRNDVVHFAGKLSVAESWVLIQAVTQSFALPTLQRALEAIHTAGYSHINSRRAGSIAADLESNVGITQIVPQNDLSTRSAAFSYPSVQRAERFTTRQTAPWQRWIPEFRTDALTLEQEILLGVGLMVQRAPVVLRSTTFAQAVERFAALIVDMDLSEDAAISFVPHPVRPVSDAPSGTDRAIPDKAIEVAPLAPDPATVLDSGESVAKSSADFAPDLPLLVEPLERAEVIVPQSFNSEAPTSVEPVVPIYEAVLETQLGGVFYLLNVALASGLYGDFTLPDNPGIELSIWDFLTLIAQMMLGKPIPDDPIWALLANVAGRSPDQAPGQGFLPPKPWQLPADWLAGQEVPISQTGGDNSQAELTRWLAWLMPHLRARLRRGLAIEDDAELTQTLLWHYAKVFVTGTRLDIILSLHHLPISIRLSGLDRNPGWIPAAGRIVTFHFEL